MTRTYMPRQAPATLMTLTCDDCGYTITTRCAPEPHLDEGWPHHRCHGLWRGARRPFSRRIEDTPYATASHRVDPGVDG